MNDNEMLYCFFAVSLRFPCGCENLSTIETPDNYNGLGGLEMSGG